MRRGSNDFFAGRAPKPRVVADVQMPTVLGIWCGAHPTLSGNEGAQASRPELIRPQDQHGDAKGGGQTKHDPHCSRLAFLSRSRAHMISFLDVKRRYQTDLRPKALGRRGLLEHMSMMNCLPRTTMRRCDVGPDHTHTGQECERDGSRHNDGKLSSLTQTPGNKAVSCPESQEYECDSSMDPVPLALRNMFFSYRQDQDDHQKPRCDDPEIAAQWPGG
jgi:hypothetical protein